MFKNTTYYAVLGWILLGFGLVIGRLADISVPIIGSIPLLDLIVVFLGLWGLVLVWIYIINKKQDIPLFLWFTGLFILIATLSLLKSVQSLELSLVLQSSQFLIRWILYAALAVWVFGNSAHLRLTKLKNGASVLGLSIFVIVLLGFIQLIIFPDLGFWEKLGWDPHQNRLVSTFLDPNLLGGLLLFGLAINWGQWRESKSKEWLIMGFIVLLAILFTYSRSALVGLMVIILGFGIREWKILLLVGLIFFGVYMASPRLQTRIAGAIDIDVTARYRIESVQQGWEIIKQNPWLGVGYNTIQHTKKKYFYQPNSNSSTGFDSSLVTIAVTTGLIGLAAYLGVLISVLYLAWLRLKQTLYKDGLSQALIIGTIALLIQSWFVNNLLYAPIMAVWWVTVGLVWKEYNDELV